ncbi:MAG: SGNH/GDSL hydrolase family protein [Oscillospiraceae bacterium]|nr:SGNH/GDSL hydrolase family protein [Oscillospiraceae bacterium]
MKADLRLLKSITKGAERIEEKDSGFNFYRFSKKEEELYSSSPLSPRTFATAGIKLHFITDAEKIDIKIETEAVCYAKFFSLDVYSDKKLSGVIKNYLDALPDTGYIDSDFPNGEFSGCFDLGKGEKEVEIYFPQLVKTKLLSLELSECNVIKSIPSKGHFLLYGGSVSQGTAAKNPSFAYGVKLSESLGCELFCKSIGSEVYFPDLAREKSEVIKPSFIMAAYGSNDWYNLTYDEAERRCRGFWKAICKNYPGAKKIALSPIWYRDRFEKRPFGEFSEMEKLIERVVGEIGGITHVKGFDLIPGEDKYFVDGIHPNNHGFELFCESFKKEFKYI